MLPHLILIFKVQTWRKKNEINKNIKTCHLETWNHIKVNWQAWNWNVFPGICGEGVCSCKSELSSCQVGPHTERTYHRPSGHTSCEAANQIKKKGGEGDFRRRIRLKKREKEREGRARGKGLRRADAHAGIIDARRAHKGCQQQSVFVL